MEMESTLPALPYDYTCFADSTPFEKEFFYRSFYNFSIWLFTLQS